MGDLRHITTERAQMVKCLRDIIDYIDAGEITAFAVVCQRADGKFPYDFGGEFESDEDSLDMLSGRLHKLSVMFANWSLGVGEEWEEID